MRDRQASSATICPLLLVADEEVPPGDICREFLFLAREHIDVCRENRISLAMSSAVWKRILELFPWQCQSDPEKRQLVALWRSVVLTPLQRLCKFIECSSWKQAHSFETSCSISNDEELSASWVVWLSTWSSGLAVNGIYTKGLVADSRLCDGQPSPMCSAFTLVLTTSDWLVVRFPWYHKYPPTLPAEGEFPFEPPMNWETSPVRRGSQRGYLDKHGNEWRWDSSHGDHWDVQLHLQDRYRRVATDGRALDTSRPTIHRLSDT